MREPQLFSAALCIEIRILKHTHTTVAAAKETRYLTHEKVFRIT